MLPMEYSNCESHKKMTRTILMSFEFRKVNLCEFQNLRQTAGKWLKRIQVKRQKMEFIKFHDNVIFSSGAEPESLGRN